MFDRHFTEASRQGDSPWYPRPTRSTARQHPKTRRRVNSHRKVDYMSRADFPRTFSWRSTWRRHVLSGVKQTQTGGGKIGYTRSTFIIHGYCHTLPNPRAGSGDGHGALGLRTSSYPKMIQNRTRVQLVLCSSRQKKKLQQHHHKFSPIYSYSSQRKSENPPRVLTHEGR